MPIMFMNEKARNHLIKTGYVVTYRKNKIKRLGRKAIVKGRGEKAFAYGIVKLEWEFGKMVRPFLFLFLHNSGFDSVEEWIKAIISFDPKKREPHFGYIYSVKMDLEDFIRLGGNTNV